MNRLLTSLALVSVISVGCGPTQEEIANGDDPIEALGSTAKSSRYGAKFWREQMASESDVWAEAIAFCEPTERADYPNCLTIGEVKFVGKGESVEELLEGPGGFNP